MAPTIRHSSEERGRDSRVWVENTGAHGLRWGGSTQAAAGRAGELAAGSRCPERAPACDRSRWACARELPRCPTLLPGTPPPGAPRWQDRACDEISQQAADRRVVGDGRDRRTGSDWLSGEPFPALDSAGGVWKLSGPCQMPRTTSLLPQGPPVIRPKLGRRASGRAGGCWSSAPPRGRSSFALSFGEGTGTRSACGARAEPGRARAGSSCSRHSPGR